MSSLRRYHGLSTNLRALQIRKLKDVKGKIIIVGDVHGCVNELNALVDKCQYNREQGDVLIMVGDYVNKGYDSIAVVRRCIELGAYGVLGNHDFTLLHLADALDNGLQHEDISQQLMGPNPKRDAVMDLAMDMPRECMAYLRQLPHIIRIPQHNVIVVHAGINVAVPLEEQDIFDVMHIRTILEGRDGIMRGSYGGTGELWAELYEGPEKIVFGHDAKTGFREYKHALALDSGCVYGNCLTAVVYTSASPGKGVIVSVPSQFNVKAGEAKVLANISPGDSPAPLVMNTHQVMLEIKKGFGSSAAHTPVTLAAAGGAFAAPVSSSSCASPTSLDTRKSTAATTSAKDSDAEVLSVMVSTVKAFIAANMIDSLALLSKIPSYASRWEEILATETAELGRNDWFAVIEQLFLAVSEIGSPTTASPPRVAAAATTYEEARLVSYLNLVTDILDARGFEAASNVSAMAHAACDGAKRKYPSQNRLVKQVKLALP